MLMSVCVFGCNELPTEPSSSGGVAGAAAADDDAGLDQAPEQAKQRRIVTGVGGVAQALNTCTSAEMKAKARYSSCSNWWEDATAIYSTTCTNGYDYGLSNGNTNSTPKGYQWYRVSRKKHCGNNDPVCDGFGLYQYIQCSCGDSSPCTVVSAFAPDSDEAEPEASANGSGAGLSAAAASCDMGQLMHASWNYFKSQTGNPTCNGSDISTKRTCDAPPLSWIVQRTLANPNPPNPQVWFAVDGNFGGGDWAFTCRYVASCTGFACKRL